MSGGIPSYHNLEWRLDVEVSRRLDRDISKPTFVLKLDTLPDGAASADEKKSLVFECNSAMMQHLGSQIAEALKAAEAPGAQRAVKYIK
mmetsp:Transcript_15650/g.48511  ORF Transcript_15650/g.48511 Transcript_15650/m.48511 type:complete len:89 (-) Transcript_15650:955-1221(-)